MNIYHITYAPARKTVCLYFWGCNFACKGCIRKKELQDTHLEECFVPEPHPFRSLESREVIKRLRTVEVEKVFFMGGEPSIDPELPIVAEEIHTEFCAYNVLLTNGFFLPSLTDIDEVCLSVKAYTPELHRDFTGKSNRKVLENFVSLYNSHVRLRSESILIPHYIDHQEIENIARFIASIDQKIPYRIDAYTPVPSSPWRSPTKGEVERAVDAARKYLCNVSCLKGDEILKYKVLRIV